MKKIWAELRELDSGCSLSIVQGTVVGQDDDDNDIVVNIDTKKYVPLPDDDDATWVKALADLGYVPLTDTVAFNGDTITFLVAGK